MAVKFPEFQELTDPPERLRFIVFSKKIYKKLRYNKDRTQRIKKETKLLFFIIVKYIQKKTNPEQQQTTVSSYKQIP